MIAKIKAVPEMDEINTYEQINITIKNLPTMNESIHKNK